MTPQYPLAWPPGWKRTQTPTLSKFAPGSAYSEAQSVVQELKRLGARKVVVSSNLQYRADGLPYSRQANMADTGVAVYFTLDGREQCIPCDRWVHVEDNLHAIALTVDALRGIERWGAKEMVNAAFRGFEALPAAGESTISESWFDVLEVSPTAVPEVVQAAYRAKLKTAHPDHGGTQAEFERVQKAFLESKI